MGYFLVCWIKQAFKPGNQGENREADEIEGCISRSAIHT